MTDNLLQNAKLQIEHVFNPDDFSPCTSEQIAALENWRGKKLPQSYIEFLLWMGNGTGDFLRGTNILEKDVRKLQGWANELLLENNFQKTLPANAFVFMMHQGYLFHFFYIDQGENPPIYYYNEGNHTQDFECKYLNLEMYLLAELSAYNSIRQRV